jgi:DNA-binding transcriptional LysR family regulator
MANLENFRLVVFRAVAERLSFRRAAEALLLTQPAVSQQIKALEEELGFALFDRAGRAIALTPAGEILLRYANQSGALLTEATQQMAALAGEQAGTLALGASTTIAQYLLPRLVAGYRRQAPRVELTVISGNTETIVAALEQHRIDLGLIEGPARSQSVATEPFLDDELVLIAPAAHEWAERGSIRLDEISSMPLLLREVGSGSRQVLEMALERAGLRRATLRVVMELDSTEAIKSAVAAGLGFGFVSRWALEQDLRLDSAFRVLPVERLRVGRQFLIARLAARRGGGLPPLSAGAVQRDQAPRPISRAYRRLKLLLGLACHSSLMLDL